MSDLKPDIIKSSGKKARFSFTKLRNSLLKTGASKEIVTSITDEIRDELYQGISTKELYNRAFALLKDYNGAYACRYRLKKAIYELGPSGFPFEKYVAEILELQGYKTMLNMKIEGHCVSHEVDIVAQAKSKHYLIECKFHSEEGRNCDVKIPLYINSRFKDIYLKDHSRRLDQGWVVTNTRFTLDAITYGQCVNLRLWSWDFPKNNGIKDLIDHYAAYPVTTSTLLSGDEKKFLLDRNIILARHLLEKPFYLDHQGISKNRKRRILSEFDILCETLDHGR